MLDKLKNKNVILLTLGAFLLPFSGFVFLANSALGQIEFHNHFFHSILLLITAVLAFYTAYAAYKSYGKNQDLRIFIISLSFYVFGFVFFFHGITIPDALHNFPWFNEAIFDVTEHYGLFLGSLVFLGLILPLHNFKETIYKNRVKIFGGLVLGLLFGFIALVVFPKFAEALESTIDFPTALTAIFFFISAVFLIKRFKEKQNTLLFYLILAFAILINSAIIPFFYGEWNALWWYFHITFLIGFAIILLGLIKNRKQEGGFENVFGEMPFYSNIKVKIWIIVLIGIVVIGAIGFLNYTSAQRLKAAFTDVLEETEEMHNVMRLRLSFARLVMPPNDHLIAGGDPNERANFNRALQAVEEDFSIMEEHVKQFPEEEKIFLKAKTDFVRIKQKAFEIFAIPKDQILSDSEVAISGGRIMEEMDALNNTVLDDLGMWHHFTERYIADATEIFENTREQTARFNTILIIFLLIYAAGAGFLIVRWVLRPLFKLVDAAREISSGNLQKRVSVDTRDEFSILAKSFNQMTDSLIETRKYPENIIRSMADSLVLVGQDGIIKEANEATADLLGYEQKELVGMPYEKIATTTTTTTTTTSMAFLKGAGLEELEREGAVHNVEVNYITKDGKEIPVSISGAAMKGEADKLIGAVLVAKDMRVAKEQENRLKASEQQQKAANQQLNAANQQLGAAQKNLQDKLLELERFNKVAVGRELKMVELKEEIARLKSMGQKNKETRKQ